MYNEFLSLIYDFMFQTDQVDDENSITSRRSSILKKVPVNYLILHLL